MQEKQKPAQTKAAFGGAHASAPSPEAGLDKALPEAGADSLHGPGANGLIPSTAALLGHWAADLENVQDPERKLQLFAAYHKSKVRQDAAAEKQKTQDEGHFFSQNAEQKAHQQQNALRDQIIKNTQQEVDLEVAFLLGKAKAGQLSAADVQKYIESKTREHSDEMRTLQNETGTLEGLSNEDRAHYLRIQMEQELAHGPKASTPAERAHAAMETIKVLPKHLQGMVLDGLDDKTFDHLVNSLSTSDLLADRHVKGMHNAERKLKLWSKCHLAKMEFDAELQRQQTQDEGVEGARSDRQKENQRLNQRREHIIRTSKEELNEEVQFLLAQQKKEGSLTAAEADCLIARKEHEHYIEMKYNVNITNDLDGGSRKDKTREPTERIAWSDAELSRLDAGLAQLPAEHVRGNARLSEIRRSKSHRTWDGAKQEWKEDSTSLGWAESGNQSVHLTDRGTQPGAELAETLAHEIGHNIHFQSPEIFQKYQRIAGWEGVDKAALKERLKAPTSECKTEMDETAKQVREHRRQHGRSADDKIKNLDARRGAEYTERECFLARGKEYRVDPYGSGYVGVNNSVIPEDPSWDYARTHPMDHFAEHYAKAIHDPDGLYKDLIGDPQMLLRNLPTWIEGLKANGSPRLKSAEALLQKIRVGRAPQEELWTLMREEVFHLKASDVEIKAAQFSRRAPPGKEELVEEFKTKAAMCVTPQQLTALEEEYNAKL